MGFFMVFWGVVVITFGERGYEAMQFFVEHRIFVWVKFPFTG